MFMKRSCIALLTLIIYIFPVNFPPHTKQKILIKSLCSTKKLVPPNSSRQRHNNILPKCTVPWHCKAFQQNRNHLIFPSKVWQTQKEAAKIANMRMSHAVCVQGQRKPSGKQLLGKGVLNSIVCRVLRPHASGAVAVQSGVPQHPAGRCSVP